MDAPKDFPLLRPRVKSIIVYGVYPPIPDPTLQGFRSPPWLPRFLFDTHTLDWIAAISDPTSRDEEEQSGEGYEENHYEEREKGRYAI